MIYSVPLDAATIPATGDVIVDSWWPVIDNEILIYTQGSSRRYEDLTPQHNPNESVSRLVQGRLYPSAEIKQIPMVFMTSVWRSIKEMPA